LGVTAAGAGLGTIAVLLVPKVAAAIAAASLCGPCALPVAVAVP
jgi:hypothetical protein